MRVMVSSTCHDLVDVRAEMEAHLREMGLSPVLSDAISSDFEVKPDVDSIETCLVNVRSSDAVIVVLSQRYGPALKREPERSRSATHLEWLEGRDHKKPMYMYVRDRTVAELELFRKNTNDGFKPLWISSERDLAGLSELYRAHRSLVDAQSGTNWFSTFRNSVELKALVSRDLKHRAAIANLRRWSEAGRLPCLMLDDAPPVARDFGSETQRVEVMLRSLDHPVIDVVVVNGADQHRVDFVSINSWPKVPVIITAEALRKGPEIGVEYTTTFGARLSDVFAVTVDQQEGRLRFRLKRRLFRDEPGFGLGTQSPSLDEVRASGTYLPSRPVLST